MICKKCQTEGIIKNGHYAVEGDDSKDTETKVFRVATYICKNPQCENFKNEIGEVKTLIYGEGKSNEE